MEIDAYSEKKERISQTEKLETIANKSFSERKKRKGEDPSASEADGEEGGDEMSSRPFWNLVWI